MSSKPQYNASLQDYIDLLKRRKLWLLLPAVIIFSISLTVAFVLPATYQSKATILVEEQKVPRDFVRSAITSYAAQQVQVISQRVLTVENISPIIKKYQMYTEEGMSLEFPDSELATIFRDAMELELISAEVIDPRSGRPTQATIAFTLAFNDSSPAIAQNAASELVTLFLNENKRDRSAQASSTADFLAAEAELLNAELLALEGQLADFKSANEGSLPEQYGYNLNMLERATREKAGLTVQREELAGRKIELSAKMAQISRSAPTMLVSGDIVMSDVDRLRALQTDYRRKVAMYRDNHPDIIRLNREINALQTQLGVGTDVEDLRRQLREQQQSLADLQSRYNDNHSEVKSTRRVIAQLEDNIRLAERDGTGYADAVADNPAYVLLETELSSLESRGRGLDARKKELAEQISYYQLLLQRAPQVEQTYQALLRDYDNTTTEYKTVKANQRDAITTLNLEEMQKGERFAVVEPPGFPLAPISPNRPAIIFFGLVLAAGVGLGSAVTRDAIDRSIHGLGQLTALLGEAPLVAIPYIENHSDIVRMRRQWMLSGISVVACVLVVYFSLTTFV